MAMHPLGVKRHIEQVCIFRGVHEPGVPLHHVVKENRLTVFASVPREIGRAPSPSDPGVVGCCTDKREKLHGEDSWMPHDLR